MTDLRTIDTAPTTAVGPVVAVADQAHGALTWTGATVAASADLHTRAGLDRDLYAIARCVSSETYASGAKYSAAVMVSIAEAIINEARASKLTPWALLTQRTSADYAWTRGAYGEQHGRYASTRVTPNGRGLAAARVALAGSNVAKGGRAWMAPRTQDGGVQGKVALKNAVTVARSWAQSGREWVGPIPGVDSYIHAVFAQVVKPRVASADAFVAMVELGRAGKSTLAPPSPLEPTTATGAADPSTGGAILAVTAAVVAAKVGIP